MNGQDLRGIWAQIDLSPEADDRIRRELMQALRRPEQRSFPLIRLRRVERRLSKTILAAIVIVALLTVAAIAAAAVKLPAAVFSWQLHLTESEAPTPTVAGSDEAEAMPTAATSPYAPETAAEVLPEPVADTDKPVIKDSAEETPDRRAGWQWINGKMYYFLDDGTKAAGWQEIDGKMYYFLDDGAWAVFLCTDNGSVRYDAGNPDDFTPVSGWLSDYQKRYYLGEDGRVLTGWQVIDGESYYFLSDGTQARGWQKINGSWYYFDIFPKAGGVSGAMVTGWLTNWESDRYYLGTDGRMATGWQEIDGKTYYFMADGAQVCGWQGIDDSWYYFDPFQSVDGMSGAMATGWQEIDGEWYYFREDGTLDAAEPDPVAFPFRSDEEAAAPYVEDSSAEPTDPEGAPESASGDAPPASSAPAEEPAEEPPTSEYSIDPAPSEDSGFEDTEARIVEDP